MQVFNNNIAFRTKVKLIRLKSLKLLFEKEEENSKDLKEIEFHNANFRVANKKRNKDLKEIEFNSIDLKNHFSLFLEEEYYALKKINFYLNRSLRKSLT